jgi:hypothetical protein
MKRTPLKRKTPLKAKKKPPTEGSTQKRPMKRKKIKPVSDKQKEINELYRKLRKVYLDKHPECEVRTKECMGKSDQIHHKELRGKNTNKVSSFCAVCAPCHQAIHSNPQWARENGFLT